MAWETEDNKNKTDLFPNVENLALRLTYQPTLMLLQIFYYKYVTQRERSV